ncbi:sodium:alanine symporter family protein [Mechercharimyces sp. CAU 1602]|uniref:alanine/glycine:cation symporter family protein n=1 Tax=Mechercharimyces sp. CAU 1602 TaxID=2973933 RepID=UPI002162FC9C|nr:alanine/glycine:cation symporter family protein [Mechercharimyces sp. CAU 1602]MCS1351959.1 alanine:cation symporter family protein [Mechercharimyces sp. CAU 1602]
MLDFLTATVDFLNEYLWSYVLIGLLLGLGVYFTIFTKAVQITYLKEMFRVLFDKTAITLDDKKQITSMQAFLIGAATRIGTGNLAGVATAIALGGPGAVFWMWIVALLGGATAFVESTLAQIYKVKDKVGFKGGPGYYIKKQLGASWLSAIFAVTIIASFGLTFNAVQSNTISDAFSNSFSFDARIMAVVLVLLSGVIIFGGIKRIARFSEIVVPFMAVFYIILALYVFFTNLGAVPDAFMLIFKSAFGLEQALGGGIGAAIMMGVKRGLFSNEAGMGSAPNAAATATVSHPAKQGFIQALGVFFDTILVCSATAFIIILSGVKGSEDGLNGIALTQAAMDSHFGSWAGIFLAIAIFTFAFSSIIGSYYYGEANIGFISKSNTALLTYRVIALGMIAFGALASLEIVWKLADLAMAFMALTNLIAIALLGKIAFAALKDYVDQRKAGKDPVFYADSIEGLKGVEAWDHRPVEEKKQA